MSAEYKDLGKRIMQIAKEFQEDWEVMQKKAAESKAERETAELRLIFHQYGLTERFDGLLKVNPGWEAVYAYRFNGRRREAHAYLLMGERLDPEGKPYERKIDARVTNSPTRPVLVIDGIRTLSVGEMEVVLAREIAIMSKE